MSGDMKVYIVEWVSYEDRQLGDIYYTPEEAIKEAKTKNFGYWAEVYEYNMETKEKIKIEVKAN